MSKQAPPWLIVLCGISLLAIIGGVFILTDPSTPNTHYEDYETLSTAKNLAWVLIASGVCFLLVLIYEMKKLPDWDKPMGTPKNGV
jgi:cell division protein FtsW (lipid II flippase)